MGKFLTSLSKIMLNKILFFMLYIYIGKIKIFNIYKFLVFHYYFFFAPNWITICASPVLFWCLSRIFINLLGPLAAYFIFISSNYFFLIFYILFLPGPCPWNIADKYLNAYLGFINFPLAFLYYNFIRSPS